MTKFSISYIVFVTGAHALCDNCIAQTTGPCRDSVGVCYQEDENGKCPKPSTRCGQVRVKDQETKGGFFSNLLNALFRGQAKQQQEVQVGSVEWFKRAAARDHPEANYWMGQHYLDGEELPKDYKKAYTYLARAAKRNHPEAMQLFGYMKLHGLGATRDPSTAKKLFEAAARQGSVIAMRRIGEYYHRRSPEQAAVWYLKAADKGDAISMAAVGEMYMDGRGLTQDFDKARAWLEKAIQTNNNPWALNQRGIMFWEGMGEDVNKKTAKTYFQTSADQDFSGGIVNLGLCFMEGVGGDLDYSKAAELFRKASDKHAPEAWINLGVMYMEGLGLPVDYVKARELFEKTAAVPGDVRADAMTYVGGIYVEGKGTETNWKLAFDWFTKSQKLQQNPEIEMFIGCQLLAGLGTEQDFAKAKKFLEHSATGEDPNGVSTWNVIKGLDLPTASKDLTGIPLLNGLKICRPIANKVIFDGPAQIVIIPESEKKEKQIEV